MVTQRPQRDPNQGPKRGSNRGRRKPSGPPHEPTQHPTRAAARGSRIANLEAQTTRRAAQPTFEKLAQDPEWAALVALVERAGSDPRAVLPKLAAYVAAILDWNRRVSNLISRNDES